MSARALRVRLRAWSVALVVLLASCTLRQEAIVADAVARAVNAAAPQLVRIYQADCDAAIDAAPPGGGHAALAACRERWSVAWVALEALATVHEAWRRALDSGAEAPTWAEVFGAVCRVARALAELPPGAQVPLLSEVCR